MVPEEEEEMNSIDVIAARLREARLRSGQTQAALAARLHVNKCLVSQYECARRLPSVDMLTQLAAELGFSLDWLLME